MCDDYVNMILLLCDYCVIMCDYYVIIM